MVAGQSFPVVFSQDDHLQALEPKHIISALFKNL